MHWNADGEATRSIDSGFTETNKRSVVSILHIKCFALKLRRSPLQCYEQ